MSQTHQSTTDTGSDVSKNGLARRQGKLDERGTDMWASIVSRCEVKRAEEPLNWMKSRGVCRQSCDIELRKRKLAL